MSGRGAGFVVAVDGPAASGKGTIAATLGASFGLPVLDSGLLYRAVGLGMLRTGGDLADEGAAALMASALDPGDLGDPALHTAAAAEAASRVAAFSEVRAALLERQRGFARRPGGAVIAGRDIGAVIAPEAPAKLYVTASAAERARRRWRQLQEAGEAAPFEAVLADIERRDARDAAREASPMRPAWDAILLDTTAMTISAASDAARRIVEAARAGWEQSPKG